MTSGSAQERCSCGASISLAFGYAGYIDTELARFREKHIHETPPAPARPRVVLPRPRTRRVHKPSDSGKAES